MDGPIIKRDTIRTQARKAAHNDQHVDSANPYPAGTAAHALFLSDYDALLGELEAETV